MTEYEVQSKFIAPIDEKNSIELKKGDKLKVMNEKVYLLKDEEWVETIVPQGTVEVNPKIFRKIDNRVDDVIC